MKLEYTLSPIHTHTKTYKWLKDVNIRQDTTKLLEWNIGKIFSNINNINVFFSQSPKATEAKAKINKKGPNHLQAFTLAETINKMKTENYRPHYEGVSLELPDLAALQPHLSYSWQPLLINHRPHPSSPRLLESSFIWDPR